MSSIRSGKRIRSLEDINVRATRAANSFLAMGIYAGDVVALMLRNDFPFFEATYAANLIGAYATPVNWHSTAAEAQHILEDSGAKAVIVHADLLPAIEAVIPKDVHVFVVATPPEIAAAYGFEPCAVPSGRTDWDEFVEEGDPYPPEAGEPPQSIIYTSGTTGKPKGVRRAAPTPEQAASLRTLLTRGFFPGMAPDEIVTIVAGPMYHSAPNAHALFAGRMGCRIILQPRFDPEEMLRLIERHRVTHIHMVPIMFNRLLRLPDDVKDRYDLSSLRHVIHAAAPVSQPIKRAMIDWWGPVICEYYGSTETSMVTFCTSAEWLAHPGTVGRATPEARIEILGPDGQPLPAGEIGEVAARNLMLADFTYHGDDDKRRRAEKRGLLVPGDIGYLDADGFLHLCDRATDMIISGGANIYPAEIEGELHKMPGVADCAVFGVPDEEFGEAVMAVVQPQPAADLTEAAVRTYLRGLIAGYKVPKQVVFANDLPREDSGKIFKRKLREPYWAGRERNI